MNPSHLILVEGPDDQYVVRAILDAHKIPCEIQNRFRGDTTITEATIIIDQSGGVNKLLKNLNGILGSATLKSLAIVVDADETIANRWESLRNVLLASGAEQVPATPLSDGTILMTAQPEGNVRVGLWLMPNNQIPGALEQFVEFLIPRNNALWERAKGNVDDIPKKERPFRPKDLPKVYLHTWLAWQKEPGIPPSQAINNRYLDSHAAHAQTFVAWVKRTFDL